MSGSRVYFCGIGHGKGLALNWADFFADVPIYGMGALLAPIGRMVDAWIGQAPLKPGDRLVRHGMLYMVLIFTAEYLSGMWLRARGICPWDYSGSHSGINGLIRLDFAPLWFATGLLFEQITKKKGR